MRDFHIFSRPQFFSRALFAFHVRNFSIFGHISRPLFLFFCTGTFLHFFHGSKVRFHGRRFKGIYSFSPLNFVELLTGIDFVFTGGILQKFSRVYFLFHVHFLRDFHIFSRPQFFSRALFLIFFTGAFFFQGKKTLNSQSARRATNEGKLKTSHTKVHGTVH